MRILCTGGRDFLDVDYVVKQLLRLNAICPITQVIAGAATGVDTICELWADQMGIPKRIFPADWATHGRRAGPLRNIKMLNEGKPDAVVAFPGGRGTAHMVSVAEKANVQVIQFHKIGFRKEDPQWGFLSNFYLYPIVDQHGLIWPATEHYYQAQKLVDETLKGQFQADISPSDAKKLAYKYPFRPDWDRVKEDVMRDALRFKFLPETYLANQLLSSGDDYLLELAPWDEYWGSGKHGNGLNRLGWLLMERRDELRT